MNKPVAQVTVTGQLQYQDRVYNANGFMSSNKPMKAIRQVPVQLYNDSAELIAETTANTDGEFSFTDIPEGDYMLRVIAQSEHATGTTVGVHSATGQLYGIEQAVTITADDSALVFDALIEDQVAGIFNILDVMTLALDFVSALSLNQTQVNDLKVFWQQGITTGTYTCRLESIYCSNGPGIYVLSDPLITNDTDEFDDDVLWHEFAHHLEVSWGMLDSPGGAHSLTNRTLDLRLAWSEGMASAFSLSLKKWLRSTAPERLSISNEIGEDFSQYYIDTLGASVQISVDLLSANSSFYRNVTNEAAVTSGILRLQNYSGVFATWQQLFNSLTENSTADTMDAFWDAMVGGLQPNDALLSQWQTTLATKQIHYETDEYESNNAASSAVNLSVNSAQTHTLYRNHYSVDEDWFRISLIAGQTYRIDTFDLTNGADTELTLYNSSYQLLDANDDAEDCGSCYPLHNGSNFSSAIEFTATDSADYFIKVRSADAVFLNPVDYGYIGRYGGYRIRVLEQ